MTITITGYWLILTLININIIIIVVDLLLTKIPSWLMKLNSQIKWEINNNIFKHLTLPTLGSLQQIIYAKIKLEGLIKMQIQICSKSPGSCWCSQYRRIQDPGEQVTTDRWANNPSLFPIMAFARCSGRGQLLRAVKPGRFSKISQSWKDKRS